MAVVSRMSIQVLQGTRVRAALKKPGHPKARSQSGLVPVVAPGQRGELQGQFQQTGPQGKFDLTCPSGLTRGNPHTEIQITRRTWHGKTMGVCIISSEEEDGQRPSHTMSTGHELNLGWGLKPQVSKWNEKDRFQAVLATQERVILTTYRYGKIPAASCCGGCSKAGNILGLRAGPLGTGVGGKESY